MDQGSTVSVNGAGTATVTVWSGFTRNDGVDGRPSTRTLPSWTSVLIRVLLSVASRPAHT